VTILATETILITGSNGYLGYAVAKRLSEHYAVVGFDRRAPSHPPPSAECIYVDLTSDPSLRRALETVHELHGNTLAAVIHFAAYYDFSGAPSPLYEKITVGGTGRLLRLLRETGFRVEQFIFSSTMLVHAPTAPGRPIDEDAPLEPTWAYPRSKVRTEEVIRKERGDFPTVVLRLAGVYDDLGHSAPLPRQIQRIFERDPTAYVFTGNLRHGQAMVHLDDVVDLCVRLVERRGSLPPELVLEVGEPETLGYAELQAMLGRLIHGDDVWKTIVVPKPLAKLGAWVMEALRLWRIPFVKPWMIDRADDHYELDIRRARAVVGWEPRHRLRHVMPKVVAALKADPWAWYRENELQMPVWLTAVAPQAPAEDLSWERLQEIRDDVARMSAAGPGEHAPRGTRDVLMTDDPERHQPGAGQGPRDEDPPGPHADPGRHNVQAGRGAAEASQDQGDHAHHGGRGAHSGHDAAAGTHQAQDAGTHAGHGAHDAHTGRGPAAAPQLPERVQDVMTHLQEMRILQAVLGREYDREMAEQRRHDAHVQRQLAAGVKGHIEAMRPLQERKALVRELPEALLRHETDLYEEAERLRPKSEVTELEHGPLMAWHVLSEHWVHIAVMPLGAWLLFSPSALAYPSAALAWSDMISGVLVILFAVLSMRRVLWGPWATALIGLWVAFAPLAFWAPDPGSYANDTMVGMMITAFSVIIPMRTEMPGPDIPPGWTYNPSMWPQRAPVIALATISFFLARYMASYQLGHIPNVWDPLFGPGTARVLTSDVSRAFPVSDSGLGAYTYLIELLSAVMGDGRRWRTMPWMVAMFGIVVIPLGITSVVLIMLQPVAVGAWCTICLITALFMLIMVAVSLDEVVAMIQFLVIGKRSGASVWRLFWIGGTLPEPVEDIGLSRRPTPSWTAGSWKEMLWGASFNWPLLAGALVGAWVMAAPWVFGTTGAAFKFESIMGALAVVIAFVAWAEVTRLVRVANVLVGLAIAIAVWLVPEMSLAAQLNGLAAGLLLIALSVPRGAIRDRYGGWDPLVV
jgi:nucleoside-diphosphate-sugar epimerase/uncharacterized membrane protein